ncbi:MAG: glutamate synthase [Limnochordales bacterium]|nr:glutamate synthase [Limnochordales bacterium]
MRLFSQWEGCPGPTGESIRAVRDERDACGVVAVIDKDGRAGRQVVETARRALGMMRHRAGEVAGEGDGTGLLLDLPRSLWAEWLKEQGAAPELARRPDFVVGHFFLPRKGAKEVQAEVRRELVAAGLRLLAEREGCTVREALGPQARREEPLFWQVAAIPVALPVCDAPPAGRQALDRRLLQAEVELERRLPLHVVSLSRHTVVYKVRGSLETLWGYYPDLSSPHLTAVACIGHNRYSTNTWSSFARVQPFSFLAHNGEINTIAQLRRQAEMIGIEPCVDGSDSQDLNRVLAHLVLRDGLTLLEAMELLFPPIEHELEQYRPELQDLYRYLRQLFGPFAQGPAAVFARAGDWLEFSVDAMGLRPLWRLETENHWVFSSEPGVVPVDMLVADPRPFAPGEKEAVLLGPAGCRLWEYPAIQEFVLQKAGERGLPVKGGQSHLLLAAGLSPPEAAIAEKVAEELPFPAEALERVLAGAGWQQDDQRLVKEMAESGAEPIASLGYDAPLAALGKTPVNLADFCQETVAVVTNPAIDREREMEHFSLRTVVAGRPDWPWGEQSQRGTGVNPSFHTVELPTPLLFHENEVISTLPADGWRRLETVVRPGESVLSACKRLGAEAVTAARANCLVLVLDDGLAVAGRAGWLDPHLALAAVEQALGRLRRGIGVILRSAGLRNLHDIMVAIGLGAEAVVPYALWAQAARVDTAGAGVIRARQALSKGIEKVIATLGIHELRGYGRLFAAIGLDPEVARFLGVVNWAGSEKAGYGWKQMEEESARRRRIFAGEEAAKPSRPFHLYPRIWKQAAAVAEGREPYSAYEETVERLVATDPVALRHLLGFRELHDKEPLAPARVDVSIDGYDYPFVIGSMSFGSQGETAYRAYAEAAYRANIVCMNGEGGELADLLGRYFRHRGIQVASGRFGITAEVVNSARFLEIKIGQGAKPGEGGHLPGRKVTPKVAAARHTQAGIELISPSNNHDIYSIEDLAQIIHELKTVNPCARIVVKVPVVPGIGTIAVGIAKAGADIINLSGFDGGTGAARAHAIRHVGLPAEIGVTEAHRALITAGLRSRVELWCDGGMKTAADVLKMILLGADRVGFGTLAMVAIGCTICRSCQLGTCHVGITTQIASRQEAEKYGLKRFEPRLFELAADHLASFFRGMGEELRKLVAGLGATSVRELVGRGDLLVQVRGNDRVDLSEFLAPLPVPTAREPVGAAASAQLTGAAAAAAPAAGRMCRTPTFSRVVEVTGDVGSGAAQFNGELVGCQQRVVGTDVAGETARRRIFGGPVALPKRQVVRGIPGNGLAAFLTDGLEIVVRGAAQDGTAKMAHGGLLAVLKGQGAGGLLVGGNVGKSFAYGAQRGLLIVQGDADSRACVRLSGADVIFAAEPRRPVARTGGNLGLAANLKGFAFEYMTGGRVVVLGDPGPWICSGMTGGVVYLRYWPEMGLDETALRHRLARGAKVRLEPVGERGIADIRELLGAYLGLLSLYGQPEEATRLRPLWEDPAAHFWQVVPQVPPSSVQAEAVSTE